MPILSASASFVRPRSFIAATSWGPNSLLSVDTSAPSHVGGAQRKPPDLTYSLLTPSYMGATLSAMAPLVKERRQEVGISIRGLAARARIGESTVLRVEEGGSYEPGVYKAIRIAQALDSTVEELFGHEADGTSPVASRVESSDTEPRPTLASVEGAGSTTGE